MKTFIIRFLVIIAAIFVLTGCSQGIKEGIVTDKTYHAAYVSTTYIKSGNALIPLTTHIPESYYIEVEGVGKKGKVVKDSIEVNYGVFQETSIGDKFVEGDI